MRDHRLKLLSIVGWFLASLLGCAGDSVKPPVDEVAASAVDQTTEGIAEPSSGDVQERAVSRMSSGTITAPSTTIQKEPSSAPSTGTTGTSYVVGGIVEPDYKYPWVVRMNGCGGVLLDPLWVLTAAHCIDDQGSPSSIRISYDRIDPYTRAPERQELTGDGIKHENFATGSYDKRYDIALIKLRQPFRITPYLQTVALPRSPFPPGIVGTLASLSNTPGTLAVYRATIPSIAAASDGRILINTPRDTTASLCPGDSGSGLVTVENGRVVVRAIAAEGLPNCIFTPTSEATFTDVFVFRDWILQTMGKTAASLAGDTRIRRMGTTARGVMSVGCINPYGVLIGPLNVVGVEEGTVCAGGRQIITCRLDQTQDRRNPLPAIVGFTLRTTMPNSPADVRALPFSAQNATYTAVNGPLPAGASREFVCQIGNPIAPGTLENTPIQLRGIENEQPAESTPESSSPSGSSDGTESK